MKKILLIFLLATSLCKAGGFQVGTDLVTPIVTTGRYAPSSTWCTNQYLYRANIMVQRLLQDTIWQTYDAFFMLAYGTTLSSEFSLINTSSIGQMNLIASPTWSAGYGWAGGSSSYLVTASWTYSSAVNFTEISGGPGAYVTVASAGSNQCVTGAFDGTGNVYAYDQAPTSTVYWGGPVSNSDNGPSWSDALGVGYYMGQTTSSGNGNGFQDGTLKNTATFTSEPIPNRKIYILSRANASAQNFFTGTVGTMRAGGKLTTTQAKKESDDVNYYFKLCGTNVY